MLEWIELVGCVYVKVSWITTVLYVALDWQVLAQEGTLAVIISRLWNTPSPCRPAILLLLFLFSGYYYYYYYYSCCCYCYRYRHHQVKCWPRVPCRSPGMASSQAGQAPGRSYHSDWQWRVRLVPGRQAQRSGSYWLTSEWSLHSSGTTSIHNHHHHHHHHHHVKSQYTFGFKAVSAHYDKSLTVNLDD